VPDGTRLHDRRTSLERRPGVHPPAARPSGSPGQRQLLRRRSAAACRPSPGTRGHRKPGPAAAGVDLGTARDRLHPVRSGPRAEFAGRLRALANDQAPQVPRAYGGPVACAAAHLRARRRRSSRRSSSRKLSPSARARARRRVGPAPRFGAACRVVPGNHLAGTGRLPDCPDPGSSAILIGSNVMAVAHPWFCQKTTRTGGTERNVQTGSRQALTDAPGFDGQPAGVATGHGTVIPGCPGAPTRGSLHLSVASNRSWAGGLDMHRSLPTRNSGAASMNGRASGPSV